LASDLSIDKDAHRFCRLKVHRDRDVAPLPRLKIELRPVALGFLTKQDAARIQPNGPGLSPWLYPKFPAEDRPKIGLGVQRKLDTPSFPPRLGCGQDTQRKPSSFNRCSVSFQIARQVKDDALLLDCGLGKNGRGAKRKGE
jgi:hypothetical protein